MKESPGPDMLLDVPTLVVTACLSFLLIGLSIAMLPLRMRARPEIGDWGRGSGLTLLGLAVGLTVVVAPGLAPLGGVGVILGAAFFSQAFRRMLAGRPYGRRAWQAFVGAAALYPLTLLLPLHLRQAVLSIVIALVLAPATLASLRAWRTAERALVLAGAAFGATALLHAARAAHLLTQPAPIRSILEPGWEQSMVFLATMLAGAGGGFGFVLACLQRETARIEDVSLHDSLTGCLRRGATEAALEQALAQCRRQRQPMAVVMMDLDYFKTVNDHWGHHAGDEVLRHFARTIHSMVRASDAFGRVGGEEFCLVLPGTDLAGAKTVAENARRAVEAMRVPVGQVTVSVTASFGVAVAGPADPPCDADALARQADEALYSAKANGRNRVAVAAPAPGAG